MSDILIYTHELTFIKGITNDITSRKCPRCGAPLKEYAIGICRYCFKYNDREENSEHRVKSNVSKISYDIPIIKFPRVIPNNCANCGAPLRKEMRGSCEYCKSDNSLPDNEWVLVEFERLEIED